MKGKIVFAVLCALAFLTVAVNNVFTVKESLAPDIDSLPEGRLIESVQSPQKDGVLNLYLVENSLGSGIRGELQQGNAKKNIFWQTNITSAECFWQNNKTVVIDSFYLDVKRGDVYDCRKGVSIFQNNGQAAQEYEEYVEARGVKE